MLKTFLAGETLPLLEPLICKLTNPESDLLCPVAIHFCLNHPKSGIRQLATTAVARSPLKLFTLASPKLCTYPALPFHWNLLKRV